MLLQLLVLFFSVCAVVLGGAFFVIIPVENVKSTTFKITCMQLVLLNFGIYHLVVIDDGNPFKENVLLCVICLVLCTK